MAERQYDMRDRAAALVDGAFRDTQQDLFREHLRQEQRELAYHKTQLASFARNREAAEGQYVERMKRIERNYDRAAAAVEKRHNGIGGRLERLTRAGRERQEATRQALEDRRATLERRATVQFNARQERQFQAEQRDRISRARELKFFRLDHLDDRQQQRAHHEVSREYLIDRRVEQLRLTADLQLRQQMQALERNR